jgi:hypothetical protein
MNKRNIDGRSKKEMGMNKEGKQMVKNIKERDYRIDKIKIEEKLEMRDLCDAKKN